MEKIKEYLERRLKRLDYELGHFEDDDDGHNLASAKQTQQEIDEVNNLLILYSVVWQSEQLKAFAQWMINEEGINSIRPETYVKDFLESL